MPESKNNEIEIFGGCFLVLVLGIAAIAMAIIQAILTLGVIIVEGALVTFPLIGVAAWITYKVETSYETPRESFEHALCLLKEAEERAVMVFLSSGGLALLSFLVMLGADRSSGEKAGLGWLVLAGTTCATYGLVLFRHQNREKELKQAEKREKELERKRQQEEAAQERARRRRRFAERLTDLRLFLEDHYYQGAVQALDELERQYPEEALTISQVRRRVKDAELAYHKKRIEPHINRLDGLLHHLDQMKQAK